MSSDFSELFQDLDEATIGEFMDEFREAYGEIEGLLLAMEEQGGRRELVDDVFRRVHSVKSNLRMVGFDPIAEFVHALEDVLDAIRHDQLGFDERLSEVVLLCMDRARAMAEAAFRGDSLDEFNTAAVEAQLVHMAQPGAPVQEVAARALALLDPEREVAVVPAPAAPALDLMPLFTALAELSGQRGPVWGGRAQRTLELALAINQEGGEPVPAEQLRAAVSLYVLACAVGPCGAVHDPLPDETPANTVHPSAAAAVLATVPGWEAAGRILAQCEEAYDGSGYPGAVGGEALCDGAQILAIADRFEVASHDLRELHERPLLRAISLVNSEAGLHFAPAWVNHFNQVIRRRLVRR